MGRIRLSTRISANPVDLSSKSLLPRLADLRRVAAEIAFATGIQAQKDGVAPKVSQDELRRRIKQTQWTPAYSEL